MQKKSVPRTRMRDGRHEKNPVVLIDMNEILAEGEAMDINSGSNYAGDVVVRAGSYADCRDSSVIVIAAGVNRKPGQTRDDLLEVNSGIVNDILSKLRPFYCNAFVIVVTNPVDALTKFVKTADKVSEYKEQPDSGICGRKTWLWPIPLMGAY